MNKKLQTLLVITGTLFSLFSYSCKKENAKPTAVIIDNKDVPILNTTSIVPPISIDSASKTTFLYNQGGNPTYTTHQYQGCPALGILGNTHFVAWQTGGVGEQPGNYLSVAVSTDRGQTWKQHKLIIGSFDPMVRHFDANFWKDKLGNLNLSWAGSVGMWDGGQLGSWYITIKYVNDQIVITKPKFLFNGVINTKPTPIGKDSSKILFPMSGFIVQNPWNKYPTTATPADLAGANIYQSTYSGKEMTTPVRVAKLNTSGISVNYAEMNIVDLGNNVYQAALRTELGIYMSNSTDAGVKWTYPSIYKDLGSTTGTRSFYARLKSGNLLFVTNSATTRTNLTAFLSTDNGKTWAYKLLIDSRSAVSYPDVMQNDQEEICLVYDRNRTSDQEINFIKFTEQDIMNGKLNTTPTVISSK
ncbi:hypothetical protein GCM10027037_35330 [Mucilaginibacter koreensis]